MLLDVDDIEIDAGLWFGACCCIFMIFRMMLDSDDFEDDAGF